MASKVFGDGKCPRTGGKCGAPHCMDYDLCSADPPIEPRCFCKSCEGDQRGLAGPCTAKPFVPTADMFVQPSAAPPGTEHVPLPPSAGRIVSMLVFRDSLYVAFEYGVYRRSNHPIARNGWEQILP